MDLLVGEVAVFNLNLFERPIVEADSVPMLLLPLLGDFLLLNHDSVGALLVAFMTLLCFEELILKVGHLDVALIVQLVDAAVENNLQTV